MLLLYRFKLSHTPLTRQRHLLPVNVSDSATITSSSEHCSGQTSASSCQQFLSIRADIFKTTFPVKFVLTVKRY